MTDRPALPEGLELVRSTKVFDQDTVPPGLLRAHEVAARVWGRLVVHTGSVVFVFEDAPDDPITLSVGEHVVIPPQRLHHVELQAGASFVVEFYRDQAAEDAGEAQPETELSTGLPGESDRDP